MTTETTPNDTPADVAEIAATTALGEAAATDAAVDADPDSPDAATPDAAEADKAAHDAAESIIGAPEAYDSTSFTMPEGLEFDTELFDLVKDDLKGMDLSQKGAERVVGLFAEKIAPKIAERVAKGLDDAGAELSASLARDLQADPEVGGAKLKESQAFAAKAIAQFIPDAKERSAFSTFFNESGLGNQPLLMRVIAGAGRALSEASTPAAETAASPLSNSQIFYGKKG